MSIFNNNTKNSRDIICDNLYITNAKKGQTLLVNDDGLIKPSSIQEISTLGFIEGVTRGEVENGFTWLSNNRKDEAPALQNLIIDGSNYFADMGFNSNAFKTIVIESPKGYIFINDRITIPDNINLKFNSVVAFGNNGAFQMQGQYLETPSALSNAPIVSPSNIPEGSTYVIVDITNKTNPVFQVDDIINIRSTSLNQAQQNKITAITGVGANQYKLDLLTPTQFFSVNAGDGTVRKVQVKSLSLSVSRGECTLKLNNTIDLNRGQYIALIDQRNAGDLYSLSNTKPGGTSKLWYSNNKFKYEIALIVDIDYINNTITIESPLSNDFDTVNTYIAVMKPRFNAHIKDLTFFYCQEPTYPRNNYHALQIETAVNCGAENILFSDCHPEILSNVQFPNINNLIRLRESHSCYVNNFIATRSKNEYSDSGASYGLTSYYNSFNYFTNIHLTTFRHNILLQGANKNKFENITIKNALISGFDMHSLNERDNYISGLYIDASKDQHSLLSNNIDPANSTIGLIRLGNSSHPAGSHYNIFNNFVLKNATPSNNVTAIYGIECVPPSMNNIFKNGVFENVDKAIYMSDHPRNRLQLYAMSNSFDTLHIKNCKSVVELDGRKNVDGSFFKVDATVANQTGTSNIIIASSATLSEYNNMFAGWILQHSTGSNFSIASYDATTKEVILTSPITTSVGNSLVLRDSLVASTNPIREVYLTNSVITNNSNIVYASDAIDVNIINNYINSNQGNAYAVDLVNCSNAKIYNNIVENTKRFFEGSNISTVSVIGNTLIKIGEQRILNDLGACSNLQWSHNHSVGFTPTFSSIAANSYLNLENERYGFRETPNKATLTLNNSNGYIGVNNSNAQCDFHLSATRNLPVQIQTTSSAYCALSLKDNNTNDSNMCQIRCSNNAMILRGSNIDSVQILNGRVGIRNTNPTQTLDVSGDIYGTNLRTSNAVLCSNVTANALTTSTLSRIHQSSNLVTPLLGSVVPTSLFIQNSWGGGASMSIATGAGEVVRFEGSGNVGFGMLAGYNKIGIKENTYPFFAFSNAGIASGSNLNTDSHGSYYGRVLVNVNGVQKWIALYD